MTEVAITPDTPDAITVPENGHVAIFSPDGTFDSFVQFVQLDDGSTVLVSAGLPKVKVLRQIGNALIGTAKENKAAEADAADAAAMAKLQARLDKIAAKTEARRAKVAKLRGELAEAEGDLQAATVDAGRAAVSEDATPTETSDSDE